MSNSAKSVWSSLSKDMIGYGVSRKVMDYLEAKMEAFLDHKQQEHQTAEPVRPDTNHKATKAPEYHWERLERFVWMWCALGVGPWLIARFGLRGAGISFMASIALACGLIALYMVLGLLTKAKYQPLYLIVGSVLAAGFVTWTLAHAYYGFNLPHVHFPLVVVAIIGTVAWSVVKPRFVTGVYK